MTESESTDVEVPESADAADATGDAAETEPAKKHGSFLRELPFLLLIAVVLALIIKTFFVQAFYIPSGSMEKTLLVGDRVFVNKMVYRFRDPHRGEIVVFNGLDSFTPEVVVPAPRSAIDRFRRKVSSLIGFGQLGEKDFIKRIIAVPGDRVACCNNGHVTVNGVELNEPYLYEDDHQVFAERVVPKGKIWVMGDHRSHSADSRINGFVPINRVVGRAFAVVWPIGHAKGLPVPAEIEKAKIPAALPAPPVLGLAAAMPITVLRRRWRTRRFRCAS